MSRNVQDHAFVTFSRSTSSRETIRDILVNRGAVGGIVCYEPHALPGEDEEASGHFHAAVYGSFRTDRFTRYLHSDIGDAHCNVAFFHQPKGKAKKGMAWPFPDMVDYVTDPVKVKVVDPTPLFFGDSSDSKSLIDDYFMFTDVDMFAALAARKDQNVADHAVIEYIASHICSHEDAYKYRIWKDYWDSVPATPPKTLPGDVVARQWQQRVIDWSRQPITADTNNRGLWLCCPPDEGKSWLLEMLRDEFPNDIFRPGVRPHGSYDPVSMQHYKGQKLILFDDVSCSISNTTDTYGNTLGVNYRWKSGFLDLIKHIADVTPITIDFGGKHTEIYVSARIIITSNFDIPEGRTAHETTAIARRYTSVTGDNMLSWGAAPAVPMEEE